MNLEGKLLGSRYEIIEKIGSGGMATVYKAKDLVLKRFVAVKVLREEFTTDNEFIKRFNTEAESAASLTHPNIVSVYDVGKEGNLYFIVMELIKGKTLKEIIVEDGRMGWKWSVKIAKQIASALEKAHRNNIIHRDIKPHNIIITEDGVAKVTDFGIAKAVSNSTITAFGTTIGSVHYFSPEHAKGSNTDAKSDLYSLGVVLYEMVTGRVPFDADTAVSVALKHMQEKPVPPIELNPVIPQSLNDLIMKAMEKEPSMRYLTATEMIEDLDKIIKNPEFEIAQKGMETMVIKRDIKSHTQEPTSHAKETGKKEGKLKKFKNFLDRHKFLKVLLIIFIFIIVFVASIAITLLSLNKNNPKDTVLENFAGMTLDEAKKKAEQSKLTINVSEEKYDVEIEEGKIISQSPKYQPNFKVKEGSTVNVVVSKGQEIVKVAKFIGMTKDEALKTAKDLGLELVMEEDYNDDIEAGIVVEQEEEEGKEVLAGSQVKIKVSLGIEQVEVPDLTGMTEEEAKAKITEAKLKFKSAEIIRDSSKGKGVVEQSLSAGSFVNKNKEIEIKINEYQEEYTGKAIIYLSKFAEYKEQYEKVEDGTDEEGNTKYKEQALPAEDMTLTVEVDGSPKVTKTVKRDEEEVVIDNIRGSGTVKVKIKVTGAVSGFYKEDELPLDLTKEDSTVEFK